MGESGTEPEPDPREQSVMEAVDAARRNYGEEIDYEALACALEERGWTFGGRP